jgi:hypothetical protein
MFIGPAGCSFVVLEQNLFPSQIQFQAPEQQCSQYQTRFAHFRHNFNLRVIAHILRPCLPPICDGPSESINNNKEPLENAFRPNTFRNSRSRKRPKCNAGARGGLLESESITTNRWSVKSQVVIIGTPTTPCNHWSDTGYKRHARKRTGKCSKRAVLSMLERRQARDDTSQVTSIINR